MLGDLRVDVFDLAHFFDRREKNFFLGCIAGPRAPLVVEIEEVAGFFKADGESVGQKIEGFFELDTIA